MDENKLNSEGVLDSEGQLVPLDVDGQLQQIVDKTVAENDPSKVKDLTQLFTTTMNKKNMVRIMKFNDLLDKVGDQAIERFERRPDNFSNKEVLDYLNIVSTINDKNMAQLKEVSIAPVVNQVQHNEVNINMGDKDLNNLPRESRDRIIEYINRVLKTGAQEVIDVTVNSEGEKDE